MSFYDDASLIMYPSGYKEDKIYSLKPTDGSGDLTFTRASSATRVNSEGLIEEVPYNLVQYSEQFDNSYWTKANATIIANSTIAPNGTTTADTLSVSVANYSGFRRQITGVSANYNISIYAKKNTKNWLYIVNTTGSAAKAWFDLDSGVLGTVVSGYTATITSVGDGWYRCTLANNTAETLGYYQIGLADANNGIIPTSSGSAYIWGAQLNSGSTAKPYFPTTDRLNVPRIDYTGGGCGSLLLEKQSTNLALESESLISSPWFSGTGTENADIAPDGTQSATLITNLLTRQNISVTVQPYTVSVFIKGSVFRLELGSVFGSNCFVIFNTSTETFTSVGTSVENYGFEKYINGWYRIFLTDTPANSGIGQVQLKPVGGLEMLIWGAQLEQGSYATSYIPTSGATVTRVQDACLTGNVPSLIGQTEGTLFVEMKRESLAESFFVILSYLAGTTAGSYGNGIYLYQLPNGIFASDGFVSNAKQFGFVKNDGLSIGTHKIAIAYKQNDFALYVDGVLIGTDTSGNVPAMHFLTLGGAADAGDKNVLNQAMLFKTRLSNAELETLTTL